VCKRERDRDYEIGLNTIGFKNCRIPWTEEPGELQSMGLQTVGHD